MISDQFVDMYRCQIKEGEKIIKNQLVMLIFNFVEIYNEKYVFIYCVEVVMYICKYINFY